MLKQPVDQFVPRIVLFISLRQRIARQQHLRFNVNKYGSHVNKISSHVNVQLANLFDVGQILRRDAGNRDIVNVDVLLADQVQQQVKRTFVNISDRNRKRRIALFLFRPVLA